MALKPFVLEATVGFVVDDSLDLLTRSGEDQDHWTSSKIVNMSSFWFIHPSRWAPDDTHSQGQ